jgi:hypothetical protein
MWNEFYLRPCGEGVVVDFFDEPPVDHVSTDRLCLLQAIVWGSRHYPELGELIPPRAAGAVDCRCLQHPEMFGPGEIVCPECGGVGWLPGAS